jgi:PAS domain S-box-containing protein
MSAEPHPRERRDGHDVRRYLRDLAALTALPAVWRGFDRQRVAEGLCDIVVQVLGSDFVFVRLKDASGKLAIEAQRRGIGPRDATLVEAARRALDEVLAHDDVAAALVVPALLLEGDDGARAIVAPIGLGCEFGVLVAGCTRPGFLGEEDRLLLSAAVNQASSVLQRMATEEAQALLASIVVSSDDAIVSKTLDGVITSWNAGAERLFGYEAAEAVGRSVTLIIPRERWDEERMILDRLRRGERLDHFETVRQAKDGRLIEVSLTVSPMHDAAGRVVGASKVARDISAQKAAERTLREADRRKDEFLAMLAHELRNPLAPIRSAVHILRAKATGAPELTWAGDVIDRQTEQLTRLVDDLLDVSRITRGKIALRKERVNLTDVVRSAIEANRPLLEQRGHQLSIALPSRPVVLDADPTRLAQVLLNLLNNAAKYTDPGGQVSLSAQVEGDRVTVRVADTGIGIPREMLGRVFELFMQGERSLDRAHGGLGIGLTLVQRLVEMHGGTVEARSEGPGRGTEMLVRLPVVVPEEERPRAAADDVSLAAGGGGRRVLVVDDNRDAADSLAMLLRMLGHEVQTAGDGVEAVQAAAAFRSDFVILDIGLPRMDGYEAARRIREEARGREIVLVALTGWGQEDDRRRSHEAGFDHHLTKPVALSSLQELLAVNGVAGGAGD